MTQTPDAAARPSRDGTVWNAYTRLGTLGVVAQVVAAPAAQAAVVTGTIKGLAGKCADVTGNVNTNGTLIDLFDCNNTQAQQWLVASDGTIRAVAGRCLDAFLGGTQNGTAVDLWDCNGTAAQQWVVSANHSLLNPQSGRCLDVSGGNSANGTALQLFDCNKTAAQQWAMPGTVFTQADRPGYDLTFQDVDSRQWNVVPGQGTKTPSALAPDTSPSIARLPDGSDEEAIVASDGTLWIVNTVGGGQQYRPCGVAYQVEPNTSPSISAIVGGGWVLVFEQAGTGSVLEGVSTLPAGQCAPVLSQTSSGTGAAAAVVPDGGFISTWADASGNLTWRTANGTVRSSTAFKVAAGTHPAVAVNGNNVGEIAAQDTTSREWTLDPGTGVATETPSAMAAGTNPSITALPDDTFQRAITASDGSLWSENSAFGGKRTAGSIAAGTSPSIADTGAGWSIAYQNSSGQPSTIDPGNTQASINVVMWPGTSPAITGHPFLLEESNGCATTEFVPSANEADPDAGNIEEFAWFYDSVHCNAPNISFTDDSTGRLDLPVFGSDWAFTFLPTSNVFHLTRVGSPSTCLMDGETVTYPSAQPDPTNAGHNEIVFVQASAILSASCSQAVHQQFWTN